MKKTATKAVVIIALITLVMVLVYQLGPVPSEAILESEAYQSLITTEASTQATLSKDTVSKTPVSKTPVSKTPVSKTPVSKTPVSKTPVSKTPVSKTPVSKTPVSKTPVSKTTVSKAITIGDQGESERAIIYFPGLGVSSREIYPVCEQVAIRLNSHVFYPPFTGHKGSGQMIGDTSASDWIHDAVNAIKASRSKYKRIIVIATSNGGAIATGLAARTKLLNRGTDHLVLISPNLRAKIPLAWLFVGPWGLQFGNLLFPAYKEWQPISEIQAQHWTTKYPKNTLLDVMKIASFAGSADPKNIQVPLLVTYSSKDRVVDSAAIVDYYSRVGDRAKLMDFREVENRNNHVLAGDIMAPRTTGKMVKAIVEFVSRNESR